MSKEKYMNDEFLNELPNFEEFLYKIGFKRAEGSIYGLLVLSDRALSSEEIESNLKLSQSAVSQALKMLNTYGAVETVHNMEGRQRLHQAKSDSLSIVSTIFKKREEQYINDFKKIAKRLLKLSMDEGNGGEHPRVKRLNSIILTCQMAETVMNFVMNLSQMDMQKHYPEIVNRLPKVLDLLSENMGPVANMAEQFGSKVVSSKVVKKLFKITQNIGGDQHV